MRSKRGYVWASGNGLYRFDGKQCVHFSKLNNRPDNIRDNQIPWIWEDELGRIWTTGNGGICYYDQGADKFNYLDIDAKHRINFAQSMCHLGTDIWFMCNYGLCRLNIKTLKIDTTTISKPFECYAMFPINSHSLLLANRNGTYCLYDIAAGTYIVKQLRQQWTAIWDIAQNNGQTWLATSDGIWCMKNDTASPAQVKGSEGMICSSLAFAPGLTGDSIIWVGTYGRGLLIFNLRSQKVAHTYLPDINNPYSLQGLTLNSIFVDEQNIVWLATENGLTAVNYRNQDFKAHLLPGNMVMRIMQDSSDKSIVWLAAYQHGIYKINWDDKKIIHNYGYFKSCPYFTNEGSIILNMYQASKYTWLLSSYYSLFTWNAQSGEEKKLSEIPVRYFIKYKKDSLFIVTADSIYLCSLPSFKLLPLTAAKSISDGQYDGRYLWLATGDGLLRYDPVERVQKTFRIEKARMRVARIDNKGRIICGTTGGACVFDTAAKYLRYYESLGGVNHPDCYDIKLKDSLAFLTTNGGLAILNLNTGQSFIASLRDKNMYSERPIGVVNDELVLGLNNEYAYFKPHNLFEQQLPSEPLIEKIKVNKKLLFFPSNQELNTLEYYQNELTFYFTAFEFKDPDNIRFRFRIEGLDTAWNYLSTLREVNYMRIPPGSYTFVAQSGTARDQWNPVMGRLNFTIVPPYWQTIWFKLLCACGFIAIVTGIASWRIRTIRRTEEQKTRTNTIMAELEMKALRSQMNPHFIFNSLNSIQKFIWENKQEDASEYLIKFSRLMRQILEYSMSKLITLEQELSTVSLYLELEHRRSNNKFDYNIQVGDNVEATGILVPPLILQPYIENAIWHGLLHKEERGELKISIELMSKAHEIRYIIEDNGIGRKRSMELRERKTTSYGMQITEQRLAIPGQAGRHATVNVDDLYDGNGNAKGTRITINIPLTDFIKI